jgi:plastocyanin domain-containing protein
MEMKQITAMVSLFAITFVIIIAIGASFTGYGGNQNIVNTVNAADTSSNAVAGDVQVVQMTMQNGDYQLSPARVKVDTPVKIVADMNVVKGCYTTVVIPDLGVRKTLTAAGNTIEFTPTKAGTFRMTCGMNMAGGQIIVEDANGNAPATTTTQVTTAGTCGASGGGCGCGKV